jgi:hypothetical protein
VHGSCVVAEVSVDVDVIVEPPSAASSHAVPDATAPLATKRPGRSTRTVAASNTAQFRSDPVVRRTPTEPSGVASASPVARATIRMLRCSRSAAERTTDGPDGAGPLPNRRQPTIAPRTAVRVR